MCGCPNNQGLPLRGYPNDQGALSDRAEKALALNPAALTDPELLQPPFVFFAISRFCRGMVPKPALVLLEVFARRLLDIFGLAERRSARGHFRIEQLDGFSVRQAASTNRTGDGEVHSACENRLKTPSPQLPLKASL